MYRLDANHNEICDAFRRCGCRVAEIARSKSDVPGIPDLVVGIPDHLHEMYTLAFVEIKTETGKLSSEQIAFCDDWRDYAVYIVNSIDDVIDVIEKARKK